MRGKGCGGVCTYTFRQQDDPRRNGLKFGLKDGMRYENKDKNRESGRYSIDSGGLHHEC